MSPEFLWKVLIALLPVLILVVVLHRLDSHRLLGTRFMVLTFLAGCANEDSATWRTPWTARRSCSVTTAA